jgi:hypothetical protein
MSITSGLTPLISYLNTTDEGKPKELKDYDQNFKDYIFDYEDPYEYATLPLYAAGPAGIIANRTIKAKRIADKAYKPSGIESILSKPGVNVGIPAATLAGDVTYDLATDEEFMGDIKTIAGIEDDALDQANEDLKDVNEKEEEEKEKSKLSQLGEALSGLAALGEPGEMLSGYMIEGTGIATPEIRRYEAGGIASLEPEMMADGGVPGFKKGIAVLIKEAAASATKKAKDAIKPKKKDKVEAKKKKSDTKKEETGVTKDKPEGPGFLDFLPATYAAGITTAAKKAGDLASAAGRNVKPLTGAALGYGLPAAGIIGGAKGLYDYFSDPTTDNNNNNDDSGDAAPVNIQESDVLKDILYQNSLERATSAGRTEPSFMDYLASFPGSYSEKVGKDPEFARQMMAGFMAMMKPTEGFVPRNALVDFGEAAMAEQVRQEDATPDQLKLMKAFAADPQLLESFTKFNQATNPLSGEELADDISVVASLIKESLYGDAASKKSIFKFGSTEKGENTPLSDLQIYQLYQSATGTPSERLSAVIGMVERET